jgi:hypothetical protein
MSDLPSYNNPKEVPGKFTIVDNGAKDEKGRSRIKIRVKERIKTRTRTRKKNTKSLKRRSLKILQVVLLILAIGALFFAGYQILVSDLNRPIIYKKKAATAVNP